MLLVNLMVNSSLLVVGLLGSQKLYTDFQLCVGAGGQLPKPPCCSRVNCSLCVRACIKYSCTHVNGDIMEEILRIFIPCSKVNNLSFQNNEEYLVRDL